jgi:hypothetical protein
VDGSFTSVDCGGVPRIHLKYDRRIRNDIVGSSTTIYGLSGATAYYYEILPRLFKIINTDVHKFIHHVLRTVYNGSVRFDRYIGY